jgi:hypothetical protein
MATSLADLQSTFGGSNPIGLSEYYLGGAIMGPGVFPNTVPSSGVISLNNFVGVPQEYSWSYDQRTSGDQNNDGAGWTVNYINGPLGWGLYATVWFYTDGRRVTPLGSYGGITSQYIKFSTANVTVTSNPSGNTGQTVPPTSTGNSAANGPTGGVISPGSDSRYGDGIYWLGYVTGYWNGTDTVFITSSYGSGGPGDGGYAYATGQVRGNWNGLGGGSNTVAVNISI